MLRTKKRKGAVAMTEPLKPCPFCGGERLI
uniref:Restriction alleviation protein n=1 Tax=Myoviridae sp. ctwVB15 TaxID=2825208 RepID=A0A8S5UNA0_9CAUD|nr:MAG TPA: restriction alleviation protein [Myoviridae sp. ctwVB15]